MVPDMGPRTLPAGLPRGRRRLAAAAVLGALVAGAVLIVLGVVLGLRSRTP